MTSVSQDVVRRLESLEQENKRLKRLGILAFGLAGAVGLTSMAAPVLCKTVWAERFVLNDSSGNTRLTLDAYRSGAPVITAQGKDGKTFAKLTLSGEAPTLELFDKKGKCTGKIGVEDGEPYVEQGKDDRISMR